MRRMLTVLTIVAFLMSPFVTMNSLLQAQEPVLLVTPKSYYYMYVIDGVPQTPKEPETTIIIGSAPNPPDPDDPTDPDDPDDPTDPDDPDDDISNEIANLATGLEDPKSSKALALLYQQAANSIGEGALKPDKSDEFISYGMTLVLAQTKGNVEAWKALSSKVEELVRQKRQAGTLSTNDDWVSFYESVAGGLNAATADHAFEQATLDEILEFILRILPILLQLFGV